MNTETGRTYKLDALTAEKLEAHRAVAKRSVAAAMSEQEKLEVWRETIRERQDLREVQAARKTDAEAALTDAINGGTIVPVSETVVQKIRFGERELRRQGLA